jgi:hypothetical protein
MPTTEQLPAEIRDLAYRNGFELSHGRWESDVREMLRRLELDVPERGGQVERDRSAVQEKKSATKIPPVPNTGRLRLIVIGAFAIGALGVLVWAVSSLGGHNTIVTGGPCSNTSAGSSSGNSVNCGVVPGSVGTKQ